MAARSNSGRISSSAARSPAASTRGRGVGLFRTEFLFLNAQTPPGEDEQFAAYAGVVRSLCGRPITFRTLDLGADKVAGFHQGGYVEPNPVLGLRSLRLSLREPGLFRPQLRALSCASVLGGVRILFPLVTTLAEVRAARHPRRGGRRAEGRGPSHPRETAGRRHDRSTRRRPDCRSPGEGGGFLLHRNQRLDPVHPGRRPDQRDRGRSVCASDPAVLRLIAMVVQAARNNGIEATVCGTIGGEPLFTMLLLGLGVAPTEHASAPVARDQARDPRDPARGRRSRWPPRRCVGRRCATSPSCSKRRCRALPEQARPPRTSVDRPAASPTCRERSAGADSARDVTDEAVGAPRGRRGDRPAEESRPIDDHRKIRRMATRMTSIQRVTPASRRRFARPPPTGDCRVVARRRRSAARDAFPQTTKDGEAAGARTVRHAPSLAIDSERPVDRRI